MTRLRRAAAGALGLCLALAACVPSLGDEGPSAKAPAADPAARPGGKIVAGAGLPGSIDPALAATPAARLAVATMCDTLIAIDPVSGAPVPSIAESWTVAERGRTLFLRLRRGVTFHNGRELVAEDVVASLTRLASEELASPVADLLEPVAGFEFVHGDTIADDERFRRSLAGVTRIDPHNVQITLDEPLADWFRVLAEPATAPVDRVAAETDAFASAPVCAGPYRPAKPWSAGQPLVLERVDGYTSPSEAATAGAGYAGEIELRFYETREQEAAAFRAGELDVAHLDESAAATGSPAGVTSVPTGQIEYVGLPVETKPFDDPDVRAALSLALDRTALSDAVYGGARIPATAFVPPVLDAYRPDACAETAKPVADVPAARRRLAAAGVSLDGVTVPLHFNDEFSNRALVEAVAAQWQAAVGLRAEPSATTWGRFLELATRPRGLEGAFRFGWAPPYPSAEAALAPLFHVDGIGKNNLSRFGNPAFNDAVRDARRAAADGDRRDAYRRAEDVLCRQMPMIPLVVAGRHIVVSDRVASAIGIVAGRAGAQPLLRELYVTG